MADQGLEMPSSMIKKGIVFGVLIVIGVVMLFAVYPFDTVSTGERAVVTDFGEPTGEVHQPGMNYFLPNPIGKDSTHIPVTPQTMTMHDEREIEVRTEDGQDVWVEVTVRYRVNERQVVTFYRDFPNGLDQWEERVGRPTVSSTVRDEASGISARKIITDEGRASLADEAQNALETNTKGQGITIEAVQIETIRLNEQFSQELEQIEIEKAEAEQRVIKAESQAEADAIRDEELTEDVLMELWIQAVNNNDKIIVTEGGQTPFILDASENSSNDTQKVNEQNSNS